MSNSIMGYMADQNIGASSEMNLSHRPKPASPQRSRFLAFPREIRDFIYEALLIQDEEIRIGCAVASVPRCEEIYGGYYPVDGHSKAGEQFPLTRPVEGRGTWKLPMSDVAPLTESVCLYSSEGELLPPVEPRTVDVHMTYQVVLAAFGRPNLAIMLACRQTHSEARKVFYSKNTFSFLDDFRIPTALYFLQDRPLDSRSHIRFLEIGLAEEIGRWPGQEEEDVFVPSGGFQEDQDWRRERDYPRLRFAWGFYQQLCDLLSSATIQLRYLGIWLDTYQRPRAADVYPNTVERCLDIERVSSALESPYWLESLLGIGGLDKIRLCCTSRLPRLRTQALIARKMRDRMLQPQAKMGTNNICTSDMIKNSNSQDFKMRFVHPKSPYEPAEYPHGSDFVVRYDTKTEEVEWQSCFFKRKGLRLAQVETKEEADTWTSWFLDGYGLVVTYELER